MSTTEYSKRGEPGEHHDADVVDAAENCGTRLR
jgi:hypothetical protein